MNNIYSILYFYPISTFIKLYLQGGMEGDVEVKVEQATQPTESTLLMS